MLPHLHGPLNPQASTAHCHTESALRFLLTTADHHYGDAAAVENAVCLILGKRWMANHCIFIFDGPAPLSHPSFLPASYNKCQHFSETGDALQWLFPMKLLLIRCPQDVLQDIQKEQHGELAVVGRSGQ